MVPPKVAVVILNWNGKVFLEEFLPCVLQYCPEYAKVYVADNGSSDNSLQYLNEAYPNIAIIDLKENFGYTGGYNKALKLINAEYYVLLNSDIKVDKPWIEPIISLMDNDNEIAACHPKILSYNSPDRFEYAGASGGFIDFLGYPFCRGRIFHSLEVDNGQYDEISDVFWATGACMFLRAEDFWKAGSLDEDFFAHMEEIDLCWRLKRMGKRVVCCPESVIYHVGGGTLPNNNPRKTYFNFRNNLLLLGKNLPTKLFYPVMILRIILDQTAALKFLLSGQPRDFLAVYKAWYYAIRLMRLKRRQGKRIGYKKVSGIFKSSILWHFYILRKNKYSQLKPESFGYL